MASISKRYRPDIPAHKYLTLPIKEPYKITEGFIYSRQERSIHGNYFHKGLDFSAPYGTPVYAAASGYAVASYHRYTMKNPDKTPRLYEGKPLGNGLGYFVQIYHPESICGLKGGRVTQYGHLSRFSSKISYRKPPVIEISFEEKLKKYYKRRPKIQRGELKHVIGKTAKIAGNHPWIKRRYGDSPVKGGKQKELHYFILHEIKAEFEAGNKYIRWIDQGDLIGYLGTSAIIWGKLEYDENADRPEVKQFHTWDEPHLHFEEAARDPGTRLKKEQRDPFDIYLSAKWYQNPEKKEKVIWINVI